MRVGSIARITTEDSVFSSQLVEILEIVVKDGVPAVRAELLDVYSIETEQNMVIGIPLSWLCEKKILTSQRFVDAFNAVVTHYECDKKEIAEAKRVARRDMAAAKEYYYEEAKRLLLT